MLREILAMLLLWQSEACAAEPKMGRERRGGS